MTFTANLEGVTLGKKQEATDKLFQASVVGIIFGMEAWVMAHGLDPYDASPIAVAVAEEVGTTNLIRPDRMNVTRAALLRRIDEHRRSGR